MAASYGFQIGKVGNDRCLLAAKREIDEVCDIGHLQLVGHSLELAVLTHAEAVQPFRQIVHLIHIDQHTLECAQHTVVAVDLIHLAVPVYGSSQFHCLEHIDCLIVLVDGDGEGDGDLPTLRALGIAQHRLDHIAHTPPPLISHSRGRGLTGWLRGGFFWGLFFRVSVRVGGVLDGSIIIRSSPARRVSPMKYLAMIFLPSCIVICGSRKKEKKGAALFSGKRPHMEQLLIFS